MYYVSYSARGHFLPDTEACCQPIHHPFCSHVQLQCVWNSQLTFRQKHIVFQSIFLSLITYALPQTVLLDSDLHALDSWYIHKIRNLLRIKHSYYSHVSHRTAFQRAGCPLLPSTFVLKQQMKFFLRILSSPPKQRLFCSGPK